MARDVDDDFEEPTRHTPSQNRRGRMSRRGAWLCVGAVLLFLAGMGTVLLYHVVQQTGTAVLRVKDKNHLQQIGLALHNYHEQYHSLPPGGIVRQDGTQMLSWQACLLPFLDQAPLYAQIKPDFAWHSPENRGVFSQPIVGLMNPANPVQSGLAVSHYAGNSHLFEINKSWRFGQILDGSSYTIAVGDVSTGFKPWGSPTNVRDPGLGIGHTPPQFGSPFPGGCHFLMLDGSVKFISENIDRQRLQDLATPVDPSVWGREDASY